MLNWFPVVNLLLGTVYPSETESDLNRIDISHNVIPVPEDEQEEMWANYNELRQKCDF